MRVYLANQRVAWEIPQGRISHYYRWRYYLPPSGWYILEWPLLAPEWEPGEMGEMRRRVIAHNTPNALLAAVQAQAS